MQLMEKTIELRITYVKLQEKSKIAWKIELYRLKCVHKIMYKQNL